jgi:hypothetical protein
MTKREEYIEKGPMQFIYYMTLLRDSPCQICFVQPLCSKSFMDGSACDLFMEFIEKKEKEVEVEGVWIYT